MIWKFQQSSPILAVQPEKRMFEAMGLETVIVSTIIGACALSFGASAYLFMRARPAPAAKDLDKIVKNAPYHRLHNVLKVEAGS